MNVIEDIILGVLLETGEIKIVNIHKNSVTDLRNKNTSFFELIPEFRCYSLSS